jgi:hypothetical protein
MKYSQFTLHGKFSSYTGLVDEEAYEKKKDEMIEKVLGSVDDNIDGNKKDSVLMIKFKAFLYWLVENNQTTYTQISETFGVSSNSVWEWRKKIELAKDEIQNTDYNKVFGLKERKKQNFTNLKRI